MEKHIGTLASGRSGWSYGLDGARAWLSTTGTHMNYWLNLFTGKTWKEFQEAGVRQPASANTTGTGPRVSGRGTFSSAIWSGSSGGSASWKSPARGIRDESRIFKEEVFPVRFTVKPLALLKPEHGVPMESLAGKLTFFPADGTSRQWSGLVRGSPTRYKPEDGEAIAHAIREAVANPVKRPVDAKQLERPANLYKLKAKAGDEEIETVVSIPTKEEEQPAEDVSARRERPVAHRDSVAASGPGVADGLERLGTEGRPGQSVGLEDGRRHPEACWTNCPRSSMRARPRPSRTSTCCG